MLMLNAINQSMNNGHHFLSVSVSVRAGKRMRVLALALFCGLRPP